MSLNLFLKIFSSFFLPLYGDKLQLLVVPDLLVQELFKFRN